MASHVSVGSLGDIAAERPDVRFTPESRLHRAIRRRLLFAKTGSGYLSPESNPERSYPATRACTHSSLAISASLRHSTHVKSSRRIPLYNRKGRGLADCIPLQGT